MSQLPSMPLDIQDEFVPEMAPAPAAPNPLLKIHHYLRGRYPWAISTGLALGAAAAVTAWLLMPVNWTSKGYIRIRPAVTPIMYQSAENQMLPMYDKYMESQVMALQNSRMILKAMESTEWKGISAGRPMTLAQFQDALDVIYPPRSEYIVVSFTDKDPVRAQAAAKAVLAAYKTLSAELDNPKSRQDALEASRIDLNAQVNEENRVIAQKAREEGGGDDLSRILAAKIEAMLKYEQSLQEATILQAYAQSMSADATQASSTTRPAPELTLALAEQIDPDIRPLVEERDEAQRQVDLARASGFGPAHAAVRTNVLRVEQRNHDIELRMRAIRARVEKAGDTLNAMAAQSSARDGVSILQQANRNVDTLTKLRDKTREEIRRIGATQNEIESLRRTAALHQRMLEEVNTQIEHAKVESPAAATRTTIEDATLPERPDKDKRIVVAAATGSGGLVLGIGIFVLVGFFDRRLKSVADARNSLDRSNRILGILPYLPEDLGDPEQAGTAAFCVHHIRTLLQIGGGGKPASVIAVTSAAPGDGKTSLVMSLGLSYAATGARTLLIDSDVIGAGLTTRVNSIARRKIGAILIKEGRIDERQLDQALQQAHVQGKRLGEALVELGYLKPEDLEHALSLQKESSLGLLDVLDGESLDDCIIDSWARNLSVLPMGNVGASHGGQISLTAVRRIIADARSKYDVVLVDTGPILGSLEACIVAAAVDEVIVTVARGQQRQLVEKTFDRLREVGARIAGIVFNRAPSEDIESGGYMSSAVSQRLQSPMIRGTSGSGGMQRLGPVARAVAGNAPAPQPAGEDL